MVDMSLFGVVVETLLCENGVSVRISLISGEGRLSCLVNFPSPP